MRHFLCIKDGRVVSRHSMITGAPDTDLFDAVIEVYAHPKELDYDHGTGQVVARQPSDTPKAPDAVIVSKLIDELKSSPELTEELKRLLGIGN